MSAAVAVALVAGQVGGDGGPGRVVEGLVGQVVDALDGGQVVGHELVEPHVDRLVGGQQVTVGAGSASSITSSRSAQ